MLYKFLAIPAFAVAVSSTDTSSQVKALAKKHIAETRAKLATVKANRKIGVKSEHKTIDLQEKVFDEESTHLRSLKMKDNFVEMGAYNDAACTDSFFKSGELVNYCFRMESTEEEDVYRSYMYKINKKEYTFVELSYDNKNCQGVPDKVEDAFSDFPNFGEAGQSYGDCFWQDAMGELPGAYFKIDYKTTYPEMDDLSSPDSFVGFTFGNDKCSTDNKNYMEYYSVPLDEMDITFDSCMVAGDGMSMLYRNDCANSMNIIIDYFIDSTDCSTTPYMSFPIFTQNCDDEDDDDGDDDGDDDDDDDDDDDGYQFIGEKELQYCF